MTVMRKLRLPLLLAGVLVIGVGLMLMLAPRPARAEGQSTTALTNQNCDTQETSFGDLTADALRDASKAKVALVASISFIKAGSLAPGPLSADRVGSMLANPGEVWAVSELSGAKLRDTLERAVHSVPLPSTSFLQVSGVTFQYDPAAPRGQRVTSVLVGLDPLLNDATYRVAMPLSLAKGGSGYFKIFTARDIKQQSQQSLADAIVKYAESKGTVSPSGFGRISVPE